MTIEQCLSCIWNDDRNGDCKFRFHAAESPFYRKHTELSPHPCRHGKSEGLGFSQRPEVETMEAA